MHPPTPADIAERAQAEAETERQSFRIWRQDLLRRAGLYGAVDEDHLRTLIGSRGKDSQGGRFWLRLGVKGALNFGVPAPFLAEALGETEATILEAAAGGVWVKLAPETCERLAAHGYTRSFTRTPE